MNLIVRYFRLCVILGLSLLLDNEVQATLTPHTSASRYAHMHEVNARWLFEASPEFLLEEVKYHSEAERIADHLLRVTASLENRDIGLLTVQQVQKRNEALSLLRAYAKTGRFPINAHHDERTPYFVDELGTHCAVGFLMHSTGASEVVDAIRTETNYGYVLEELSAYPAIADWGVENGFTKEELAWIQPSYLHLFFTARPFGNNLGVSGGAIYSAESSARGVYLGGSFTEVDGIPAAGLAYLRNEVVEEVVQPYPTIKVLTYDTLRELLYAHGVNHLTNEAAVFTLNESRTVSILALAISPTDSIHFEQTAQGVAILQQTVDSMPQANFYHHTIANGVVPIVAQTDWQGTVYDIKTWGDTLAIGGNFLAYEDSVRVDSNCAYLSLSADILLPDTDEIQVYLGGLTYDTIPGSPIILNFLNVDPYNTYRYLLSTTPIGNTISAGYFYNNGIFSPTSFDTITTIPTPWTFPSVLKNATSTDINSLLVSGRQDPQRWLRDSIRSVFYWWESASLSANQINCNGQIKALETIGDSLLIFGNFNELAGQQILSIGIAESRLSDSKEPLAKEDYKCYVTNHEVVVSFSSALPQNATLHLYSIDGRHLRQNVLAAGQTEFRFSSVDQRLMSYVIQTEDGIAAGVLIAR